MFLELLTRQLSWGGNIWDDNQTERANDTEISKRRSDAVTIRTLVSSFISLISGGKCPEHTFLDGIKLVDTKYVNDYIQISLTRHYMAHTMLYFTEVIRKLKDQSIGFSDIEPMEPQKA